MPSCCPPPGREARRTATSGAWPKIAISCFILSKKYRGSCQEAAPEQRKLSRAATEVLAIIAYHQPVTRAEIEDIRGVAISKGTLDVLLETGWIRLRGRRKAPGRPITYGTTGTAPNRELVVSWNSVRQYSGGGSPVTGQIILHETSNTIEIQCATCVTDGRLHTQGAESPDGMTAAFLPGRVAASFSARIIAAMPPPAPEPTTITSY